jgi:MFS family permease
MNANAQGEGALNNPFIPLRHSNFRYYWVGMWVSLIGTWMQSVAQPWLAYSITHSAFLLGLVGALQYLPMLLFALFAGVVVDRLPTEKLIYFTQAASLLIVLLMALLVYSGHILFWHILVLATALGVVNTLDMPARQAFVIQLVGKEDLMNAIALNSVAFNSARVIGPAIAGLLIGGYGVGICFLLNGLSFAAVLVSLIFIKPLPYRTGAAAHKRILTDIKAGLSYVYQHRSVLEAIILMAIIGTFAMNNNVLVPVFNQEVLHQDARGFGFLLSFSGVGSLIGALLIAAMSSSGPKKWVIYFVPLLISVFLILNSFTRSFWLTGFYLAVTGLFFNLFSSTINSTVQIHTPDELRGRVMSLYSLVFVGSTPVGNLYAGWSDEYWGAQYGFAACGVMVLILLLPVYVYKLIQRGKESEESLP